MSEEHDRYLEEQSQRRWERQLRENPTRAKLLMAAAYLARLDLERDNEYLAEKRSALKHLVGMWLASCEDKDTLRDPIVKWQLVMRFFGSSGLRRLEARIDG